MKTINLFNMYGMGLPITAKDVRPTVISECITCRKNAQTTLKGKVYAANDKQPLPGTHVINRTEKTGTTTGNSGEYSINVSSNDEIEISYMGYKTLKMKAKDIPAVVFLQEEAYQLDAVVVTPRKNNLAPSTGSRTKVEVTPSLNNKIKKASSWIWIAIATLVIAGGTYYFSENDKKTNK